MEIKNISDNVKKLNNTSLFNYIKQNILPILILILVVYNSYSTYTYKSVQLNDRKIDSLNVVIIKQNEIIKNKELKIDSLNNTKTKTVNNYETIIKDFSNTSIVSDDSVTKYISKKIYNK